LRRWRSFIAAGAVGTLGVCTAGLRADGVNHVLEVRADGSVWASGANDFGQLGDGTHTSRAEPQRVDGLADVVAAVACPRHSLALTAEGDVLSWGDNRRGQLGDNSRAQRTRPVRVLVLTGVASIACEAGQTTATKADGSTWRWGGVRGTDPNEDELVPSPVAGPSALRAR